MAPGAAPRCCGPACSAGCWNPPRCWAQAQEHPQPGAGLCQGALPGWRCPWVSPVLGDPRDLAYPCCTSPAGLQAEAGGKKAGGRQPLPWDAALPPRLPPGTHCPVTAPSPSETARDPCWGERCLGCRAGVPRPAASPAHGPAMVSCSFSQSPLASLAPPWELRLDVATAVLDVTWSQAWLEPSRGLLAPYSQRCGLTAAALSPAARGCCCTLPGLRQPFLYACFY